MSPARVRLVSSACVAALVAVARPAEGVEWSGGLSLGGILVGTVPRFAVSPHGGLVWSRESGLSFVLHEACSVLPSAGRLGLGVYNQASAALGYAAKEFDVSVGPSLSIYSMPACGPTLCGRVIGLAPGGRAATNLYFAGRLGVSLSASVDWVGGSSLVLPGGIAAMIAAGPILRWEKK